MYPALRRGDTVVCDSCGWSGEGVYAVTMNGKGLVKRVTQRPGKVVLLSDNPKYPPLEDPEESQDIEIVGRVHCAITNFFSRHFWNSPPTLYNSIVYKRIAAF
jgi:phage repressor protein C with HTH and peptisase S24 domain